jgi:hypothetical protein
VLKPNVGLAEENLVTRFSMSSSSSGVEHDKVIVIQGQWEEGH